MRWTKKEIRSQLADLGAYRDEVEALRNEAARTVERLLEIDREHDDDLKRISRATAEWSIRAGQAGLDEAEVLELLGLPRPVLKRRP